MTTTEGTLTAWIGVVTMTGTSKFFILSADEGKNKNCSAHGLSHDMCRLDGTFT